MLHFVSRVCVAGREHYFGEVAAAGEVWEEEEEEEEGISKGEVDEVARANSWTA